LAYACLEIMDRHSTSLIWNVTVYFQLFINCNELNANFKILIFWNLIFFQYHFFWILIFLNFISNFLNLIIFSNRHFSYFKFLNLITF
jgi:hypothetical protein